MGQVTNDSVGRTRNQEVNGLRPRVLMCPFTNPTNRYIEIQKDLYRSVGYDVAPLSIKGLLKGGFFQLFKPDNILVFHWLEYRPFRRQKGTAQLSLLGSLLFAFYCSLMLIGRAKVVYFVHDQAVHDTVGFNRRLSIRLIAFIRRLADFRVVHAPDFQVQFSARYLPHPLYWDAPGQPPTTPRAGSATPLYSMLGVIRPYKQIDAVLDVWPSECKLDIAGHGTEAYVATLNGIIDRRSLRDTVRLDAKFLSDAEFAQRIADSDVLILPHAVDSMLVSGAFFEAIGRVPLVISRSTPFMIWAASKFDNVILFDDVAQLPEIIGLINSSWPTIVCTASNRLAVDEFGWNVCCRRYEQFFETVVGHASAAGSAVTG
ncbi:glycosyltransferase [Paraburkholderia sp. MM5477-R1]|uniref:glycosyltransferase n=1 Tax=Paraburkholderia sp. MM5477-R1 TaxID=2991062 RepID=UPI003D1B7B3B